MLELLSLAVEDGESVGPWLTDTCSDQGKGKIQEQSTAFANNLNNNNDGHAEVLSISELAIRC